MRVLVTINGIQQVDEIYENEMVGPRDMKLWTHEDLMDIIVHGVGDMDLYTINKQLLEQGYADLSKYRAEYCYDEKENE